MSDLPHFIQAPADLHKQFTIQLDKTAEAMGRTGSRDDHVDWSAVNEEMQRWWEEQGYSFP